MSSLEGAVTTLFAQRRQSGHREVRAGTSELASPHEPATRVAVSRARRVRIVHRARDARGGGTMPLPSGLIPTGTRFSPPRATPHPPT